MTRVLVAALVALMFALPVSGQSSEVPAPGLADFAYSAQVVIDEEADAYAITLSPRVYRDLASDDLSDIRIFNGEAAAVPHGIRSVPPPSTTVAPFVTLPVFPLSAAPGAVAGTQLSLRIDGQGLSAALDMRGPASAHAVGSAETPVPAPPEGYLLDAEALTGKALAQLHLGFAGVSDVRGTVSVEASDDLAGFESVVSGYPVLRVTAQGRKLERLDVPLGGVRGRYLRLRLHVTDGAQLVAVSAQGSSERPPPPLKYVDISGRARPNPPGTYDFDIGGPLPVTQIALRFAQDNTVVQAELRRSAENSKEAELLFSGTFYRVGRGDGRVESPEIAVGVSRGRQHYVVKIDEASGALGAGDVPVLRAYYAPDQVVFLPRGMGPYVAGYGHAGYRSASPGRPSPGPASWAVRGFSADTLLGPLSDTPGFHLATAQLGATKVQAGEAALEGPSGGERSTWVLWAVLGAAVLGLMGMVVHLLKGRTG